MPKGILKRPVRIISQKVPASAALIPASEAFLETKDVRKVQLMCGIPSMKIFVRKKVRHAREKTSVTIVANLKISFLRLLRLIRSSAAALSPKLISFH